LVTLLGAGMSLVSAGLYDTGEITDRGNPSARDAIASVGHIYRRHLDTCGC
jgi:hypothetical protein